MPTVGSSKPINSLVCVYSIIMVVYLSLAVLWSTGQEISDSQGHKVSVFSLWDALVCSGLLGDIIVCVYYVC